jgi:DNA-binding winged helix-turn-helix (wHTH) protein
MNRQPAAAYVFGQFRLSEDGTLLARNGVAIALAPKVLHTLLVLVQRAGTVVRKDDLLKAVWPDSFVEDTGLTRNISLLRQALGDDDQRVIVTVARIGYRFAEPVTRVSAAIEAGGPRRKPIRHHGDRAPIIVGRDRELARLHEALERARSGRGGIMAVAGEPGIGKTTLVERFLDDVPDDWAIGHGRCSERLAGAEPHLPVLEALDELTTTHPTLVETLSRTAPTWSQYVAPASGLGVATTDVGGNGSPQRLMRELTSFLEEAARTSSTLVLIEDLHWADASTIDVLAHLAPRLARTRVLVVVTYRLRDMLVARHYFSRLRGELIAAGHLDEMSVSLLGQDHVREYLQTAFGVDSVPAELPPLVFARTEGNPLFMVEVVRYIRQRGTSSHGPALTRDVPDSLRGLIDTMLDALEPETRQLLAIAAVQGYEFDSSTLARVSGRPASDVEDRLRIAERIHALVTYGSREERSDGGLTLVYRFGHVLYQDALLASLAPSRHSEWARLIAEALTSSHAGHTDDIAGSLAMLFESGREFWKASEFFLNTSRQATRRFAFAPAIELADRGLRCLNATLGGDEVERSRRILDLSFARLVPMASLQGYASPDVELLTQSLVALAEALGDVPATATALGATWFVRMVRGECLAAKQAGTKLAALSANAKNDVHLINAHMNAQIACHHLGEFAEARDYAAKVSALAGRVAYPARCVSILDPVVASLSESARNRWITGDLAGAVADCEAAVALGRTLRHPDSLAFGWVFHAWIHGYRRDWTTCLGSAAAGIAIASESGSVQTLAWNQCVHGWALAHVGDVERGTSELSAAIEMSKRIMGHVALPQLNAMMAEVLLLRGELESAETWLTEASAVARSLDDRYFDAEVRRLSATCCAQREEFAEAIAGLRDAIAVARMQGAAMFELRAAVSLAQLEPPEGRKAIRAALEGIKEPEAWPDVRAAQEMLR